MKAIGVVLSVFIYIFIALIPILSKEETLKEYGMSFVLGLSQGFLAIYMAIKFYSWFKSNIK